MCGDETNRLYRNEAGMRFVDVSSEMGIISQPQKTSTSAISTETVT